ncbi:MAG: hypothetical protein LBD58_04800 [Treponema sp.]|jgi:hypothetical protein|nr:hypothetical protein [Treponema sp.]
MKRIVYAAYAIILAAATAGTAFAQEFKWDGYINSGLGLVMTDRQVPDGNGGVKNAEPYLTAFGVDSQQWGYRFRLNGSYTNEAKTAGVKLRLQGQSKTDKDSNAATKGELDSQSDPKTVTAITTINAIPVISLPIAYGWLTFFDAFTLNAGIIDDSAWTAGGHMTDDMGEGLGLSLKISPVSGLDLGIGAYAISSLGSGDNNTLAAGINKNVINVWNAKYTFNVGYTLPNAFKITATFRPKNDAGGSSNRDESMKASAGLRLLMVKDMTAIAEAYLDKLEEFDSKGAVTIFETLGYKIGGLSFGLNAGEYIVIDEKKDFAVNFNPWVSYALGGIAPRLDVVCFLGGQPSGSSGTAEGSYPRIASYSATNNAKDSVVGISPSVKFAIDGKTSLEIGDAVNFEQWHENHYGASGHKKNGKITNVFYIDVKWSF